MHGHDRDKLSVFIIIYTIDPLLFVIVAELPNRIAALPGIELIVLVHARS